MKRQKRQKPLDFWWSAGPYNAKWAYTPEEVPIWDTSRGFPLSEPDDTLKPLTDDLEVLRVLLDDETWEPAPAPKDGYPRLVRANYTEPVYVRSCGHVDILNRLMRLLRKEPLDKWAMGEILALNAEVGPVKRQGRIDNTLESWLNLARVVQAHMRARNALDFGGYSAMREEAEEYSEDWQKKHGRGEYNPYRHIISATLGGTDEQTFRFNVLKASRDRIHGVTVATDRTTLNKILVTDATLYTWAHYRIGDIWEPSAEVAECEGCKNLFLNRRTGKLYCSGACRNRKYHDALRATA